MSYIIKLISENCYIIPDNDGWLTTTESREEAIKLATFDSFGSANETALSFSGGMTHGVDYHIESISLDSYHVVQITIPVEVAPKFKGIDKFIFNDKAQVFLTNSTTENDAMEGITRYGVSTGTNAILLKNADYEKSKAKIENYLNEKFENQWELKLIPVKH